MSENSQLSAKVKDLCDEWTRGRGAYIHRQRFTDKMYKGIPDSNLCRGGVEAWIECKFGPDAKLSAEQKIWLNAHQRAGGRVFVLLQVERIYSLWSHGFENWPKSPPLHVWSPQLTPESFFHLVFDALYAAPATHLQSRSASRTRRHTMSASRRV